MVDGGNVPRNRQSFRYTERILCISTADIMKSLLCLSGESRDVIVLIALAWRAFSEMPGARSDDGSRSVAVNRLDARFGLAHCIAASTTNEYIYHI